MAISLSALGQVAVEEAGVSGPFTRPQINFIQGGATAISVVDNGGSDRVDVTITSTDTTGMSQLSSSGQRFAWTGPNNWAGAVVPQNNFSTMICFTGCRTAGGTAEAVGGGVHACFSAGCGFVNSNFSGATLNLIGGGTDTSSGRIFGQGSSSVLFPTNNGSGGNWNGTSNGTSIGVTGHATWGWNS
jgi:hypothetical protein